MSEIKVVYVDIDNVIPYENNPRINDDAVGKVAASIREFGWQQPIVVDKNNVIIVGHTRLKAAQQLGMKQVPVVFADLSEEKAKAYRLADNKTNEFAQWDFELLEQELAGLEELEFDMEDFGFDGSEQGGGEDSGSAPNLGETGFNYQEQYGVIVMCKDEAEQEKIYTRLTEEGYECKVVAT